MASAGASLIPSPTIATCPCSARSRSIASTLSSGRSSASTSSIPSSAAIARAVRSLSPLSIAMWRMPSRRMRGDRFAAPPAAARRAARSAPAAGRPRRRPRPSFPAPAARSASAGSVASRRELREQAGAADPHLAAVEAGAGAVPDERLEVLGRLDGRCPARAAWATIACGERMLRARLDGGRERERLALARRRRARSTSVTCGRPAVSVPVLSKAITRIRPSASSWAPPLIRMPSRPPRLIAAATATGTDITSAQGAAATSDA